jgi:ribonuclease D
MNSSAETAPASPVVYLQTNPDTAKFLDLISTESLIAVDTEAASFHRYHDRTYLLQVSTRTQTVVIDPLTVDQLAPLGAMLADPGVEVIFHDADYDLRMLDRDYGFSVTRVFDTRIAAQLLNEPAIGLAALLERYIGVRLDKRFQRADWSRRPLLPEMLAYAATDTRHLPDLRDILKDRLRQVGRLAWAEEEFGHLNDIRWEPGEDEGFWKIKGSKLLRGQCVAVLQELYQWRDQQARRLDRAPFRVLNNETLLELARHQPRDPAALGQIKGMSPETVQRRGPELLAAVGRGLAVPDAAIPRPERGIRTRPDPAFLERVERLKLARNAAATRLDLPPGVLCPNGTLEQVAKANPRNLEEMATVPELRTWQREEVGPDLLKALRES